MLVRCCCGAAISLANGLRRRPVNTNLHAISAKNAIRESVVYTIQIPCMGNELPPVSGSAPMLTKSLPAGVVSVAARAPLAPCNGVNPQHLVLLPPDFLDAFA